jgi:hypothetical protein
MRMYYMHACLVGIPTHPNAFMLANMHGVTLARHTYPLKAHAQYAHLCMYVSIASIIVASNSLMPWEWMVDDGFVGNTDSQFLHLLR